MKIFAEYKKDCQPPALVLYIHGAPHRRMHRAVFDQYRKMLIKECEAIGMRLPIRHEIELRVYYINPTSPDFGNIYLALEMCMDGRSRRGIVSDDSLIDSVVLKRMYS